MEKGEKSIGNGTRTILCKGWGASVTTLDRHPRADMGAYTLARKHSIGVCSRKRARLYQYGISRPLEKGGE